MPERRLLAAVTPPKPIEAMTDAEIDEFVQAIYDLATKRMMEANDADA